MRNSRVNPVKKIISEGRATAAGDHETRRQVLEAAQQLFLAKGYKGVSMKEVAEVVQVTSAALLASMYEGMSISVLRDKHMAMGGAENIDAGQLATLIVSVLLQGIVGSGEITL